MHDIKIDVAKNRLYVKLHGFTTLSQTAPTIREMEEATGQLRFGFDVVTDLSDYKPALQEVMELIGQMQKYLRQSGMRRVVRVGARPITQMQFARQSRIAGYEAATTSTVEEADRLLDNWFAKPQDRFPSGRTRRSLGARILYFPGCSECDFQ